MTLPCSKAPLRNPGLEVVLSIIVIIIIINIFRAPKSSPLAWKTTPPPIPFLTLTVIHHRVTPL